MHYFKSFKGFKNASVELYDKVTILIGNNGSGKTNLIEGVDLLANLATGRPLYEIADINRGEGTTYQIRGGLQACPTVGSDKFTCGSKGSLSYQDDTIHFDYSIEVTVKPNPRITREVLIIGSKTYFEAKTSARSKEMLSVLYDNFTKGPNPITTRTSEKSILSRYEDIIADVSSDNPKKERATTLAAMVRSSVKASYVFDPNPRAMRYYERIGQKSLLKDGSNLSSVLHHLSNIPTRTISVQKDGSKRITFKKGPNPSIQNILSILKQVPEEPFADFEFIKTRLNDVILALNTENGLVDARLLSDGTLRCLAVLTAFETVPKGSRIVIEEIDNGLHPSRTGDLLAYIWDVCARRNLNALITTHNSATLNNLTDEQLKCVKLCYWDKAKSCSTIIPLLEIKDAELLLERGKLGNLASNGSIQRHFSTNKRHGNSLTSLLEVK